MAAGAYFIAQVMGRAAGWLAYGAAIAGEAASSNAQTAPSN